MGLSSVFYKRFQRAVCALILVCFISGQILPAPWAAAQSATILNLPLPGAMVGMSPKYVPIAIKGMKVFPDNPFRFDFILDTGNSKLSPERLNEETRLLIKYFLTALTVPDDDQWVNLSPYEKERIVPNEFGITEMGRDLLAQDYLLKQLTASLVYPEHELGKKFWERVYKKAYEKYGDVDIPVSTFNKVWVMPESAKVYEYGTTVIIKQSHLKVMLEEDYLAFLKSRTLSQDEVVRVEANQDNAFGSQIVRDIVLPEIEKEINEGKNFTKLRQIYQSIVMAAWYKRKLKDGILGKMYVGANKVSGVDASDREIKQKIYEQYVAAFKKGVYNYIREDVNLKTKEIIPRKYFSGGVVAGAAVDKILEVIPVDQVALKAAASEVVGDSLTATVRLDAVDKNGRSTSENVTKNAAGQVSVEAKKAIDQSVDELIAGIKGARKKMLDRGLVNNQYILFSDEPDNAMNSLPALFRRKLLAFKNKEEISLLAETLNEQWQQNGFDDEFGSLYEYVAHIFSDYFAMPSEIKANYTWLYNFLDAAQPLQQAYALRLLVISFINHTRSNGFHPETDTSARGLTDVSYPMDVELLTGNDRDLTGKQIFQRYILSLLELQSSPQWTQVIPGGDGLANKMGLTHEQMLLWALVLLLDPTIYYDGVDDYSEQELNMYLSRYFGQPVDRSNAGIKFLTKAFGHRSLAGRLPELEPLIEKAFAIADSQWLSKGQRSPFDFAFQFDNLNSIFTGTSIMENKSSRLFADPMLMLGSDFSYWSPQSLYMVRPSRSRNMFPVLSKQGDMGLRPLYITAYTSAELSAIFPDLSQMLKEKNSGGALKDLSVFDPARPVPEPTDAVLAQWEVLASTAPADLVTVRDQDVAVKIIEVDPQTMPSGMTAYHFMGRDGKLIIVLPASIQKRSYLEDEIIMHEAQEAYWARRLKNERSIAGRSLTTEVLKAIKRDSHILAWADQILEFAQDGLTPLQKAMLPLLSAEERIALKEEKDRSYQDNLVKRYDPDRFEEYLKNKQKFQEELAVPTAFISESAVVNPQLIETYNKLIALSTDVAEWKLMNLRQKWEERSDQWSLVELIYSPGGIQKAGLFNADGTPVVADIRGNYPHWVYKFLNEFNDNIVFMGQDDVKTLFPGRDLLENMRVMRAEKEEEVRQNTKTVKTIVTIQKLLGATANSENLFAELWDEKKNGYIDPGDRHIDLISQVRQEFDQTWQRDFSNEISLERFLEIYADLFQAVRVSKRWGKLGYLAAKDQSSVAEIIRKADDGLTISPQEVKILIKVHAVILDLKNSLSKESLTWASRKTQAAEAWVNSRRPAYHANIWIANWLAKAGLNNPSVLDAGANASVLWSALQTIAPELAGNVVDLERDKDIFESAPNPLKVRADISDLTAGVESPDPTVSALITQSHNFDVITMNFVLDQLKPKQVLGALKSFEHLLATADKKPLLIITMPKGSPLQGSEFEKVIIGLGYRPIVQAANLSNQLTMQAESRIREEDGEEYLRTVKATLTEKVFHVGVYQKTREVSESEIESIDEKSLVIRTGQGRVSNGKGTNGIENRFAPQNVDLNDIFASLQQNDIVTGSIEIITVDELKNKQEFALFHKDLEVLVWFNGLLNAKPEFTDQIPRLRPLRRISGIAVRVAQMIADPDNAFVQANLVRDVMSAPAKTRFSLEEIRLLSDDLGEHFTKLQDEDNASWEQKNKFIPDYDQVRAQFLRDQKARSYSVQEIYQVNQKLIDNLKEILLGFDNSQSRLRPEIYELPLTELPKSLREMEAVSSERTLKLIEQTAREFIEATGDPESQANAEDVAAKLGVDVFWLNYLLKSQRVPKHRYGGIKEPQLPVTKAEKKQLLIKAVESLRARGFELNDLNITNVGSALGLPKEKNGLSQRKRSFLEENETWESVGVMPQDGHKSLVDDYTDDELLTMTRQAVASLRERGIRPTNSKVLDEINLGTSKVTDKLFYRLHLKGFKDESLGIMPNPIRGNTERVFPKLIRAVEYLDSEGKPLTIDNIDAWIKVKYPDLYKEGWLPVYNQVNQERMRSIGIILADPSQGGALKQIGLMGRDRAINVPAQTLQRWGSLADVVKEKQIEINGQKVSARIVTSESSDFYHGKMPDGLFAYHFRNAQGQLIIVLSDKLSRQEMDEAVYHEFREDYWERELAARASRGQLSAADQARIPWVSHVLASAEESIAYGQGQNAITAYHIDQIRSLETSQLEALVQEDRNIHQQVIKSYLTQEQFAQYLEYEQRMRAELTFLLSVRRSGYQVNVTIPVFKGIERTALIDRETRKGVLADIRRSIIEKVLQALQRSGESHGELDMDLERLAGAAFDSVLKRYDSLSDNVLKQDAYLRDAKVDFTYELDAKFGNFKAVLSDTGEGISRDLLERLRGANNYSQPINRTGERIYDLLQNMMLATMAYNLWDEIAVVSRTLGDQFAYRFTTGVGDQPSINDHFSNMETGAAITISGRPISWVNRRYSTNQDLQNTDAPEKNSAGVNVSTAQLEFPLFSDGYPYAPYDPNNEGIRRNLITGIQKEIYGQISDFFKDPKNLLSKKQRQDLLELFTALTANAIDAIFLKLDAITDARQRQQAVGRARIIFAFETDSGNDGFKISLSDTGVGVEKEILEAWKASKSLSTKPVENGKWESRPYLGGAGIAMLSVLSTSQYSKLTFTLITQKEKAPARKFTQSSDGSIMIVDLPDGRKEVGTDVIISGKFEDLGGTPDFDNPQETGVNDLNSKKPNKLLELPSARFGAAVDLEGILAAAARESLGYVPLFSVFGSYTYIRTAEGLPDWDHIGDLDIRIHARESLTFEQYLDFKIKVFEKLKQEKGLIVDAKDIDDPKRRGDAQIYWGIRDIKTDRSFVLNFQMGNMDDVFEGKGSFMSYRVTDKFFGDVSQLKAITDELSEKDMVQTTVKFYQETMGELKTAISKPYTSKSVLGKLKTLYQLAVMRGKSEGYRWLIDEADRFDAQFKGNAFDPVDFGRVTARALQSLDVDEQTLNTDISGVFRAGGLADMIKNSPDTRIDVPVERLEMPLFSQEIPYVAYDGSSGQGRSDERAQMLQQIEAMAQNTLIGALSGTNVPTVPEGKGYLLEIFEDLFYNSVDAILQRLDGMEPARQVRAVEQAKLAYSYREDQNTNEFEIVLSDTGTGISGDILSNWKDDQFGSTKPEGIDGEDREFTGPYFGRSGFGIRRDLTQAQDLGYTMTIISRSLQDGVTRKFVQTPDGNRTVTTLSPGRLEAGTDVIITGEMLRGASAGNNALAPAQGIGNNNAPGGIDMNAKALKLQTEGQGTPFDMPFDPAQWENIQFEGFTPVILKINTTNLPLFIGAQDTDQTIQLSAV